MDFLGKDPVVYVGLQRSGTKSFGAFFEKNGYRTASWEVAKENGWPSLANEGRYNALLSSPVFKAHNAFEDTPWYFLPLIKFVYWEVPRSRFVFFRRPFDDWFASMLSHSGGRTVGETKRHCQVYDRLFDYYSFIDGDNAGGEVNMRLEPAREHYRMRHLNHEQQLRAFFEDKPADRYFDCDLYDPLKWTKMSDRLGLALTHLDDVHVHRTPPERRWRGASTGA